MIRFCLLLLAGVLSLKVYCQETGGSVGNLETVSDEILNEDNYPGCSDDVLTFMLSEDPVEEVTEGAEIAHKTHQEETTAAIQFDYRDSKYWGRYTALRAAGWITFGAGMGFFMGGYAMILGAWAYDGDAADALGVAGSCLLFSAPVLVLASIPLLACAYYNRGKAKRMQLNVGASLLPSNKLTLFEVSKPALSFALTF